MNSEADDPTCQPGLARWEDQTLRQERERLTQEIRSAAMASGADLVGFVSAQALEQGAPDGHKPSDLLQGTKSVIVLACGRQLNEDREYYYRWGPHFSLTLIKLKEDIAEQRALAHRSVTEVARLLENAGFKAVVEHSGWSNVLSFKMVSYLAGLGVFGKGGFLIHPEHGPLNILACIATDAALEYGSPLGMDLCGECVECLKACKYGALSAKGFDGRFCRVYDRIVNPVTEKWAYGPCNSKCVNQCPLGR